MLSTLLARDRLLGGLAVALAVLFVGLALAALVDSTEITGVDRWIKPMKFAISIAIYLATIGWFTADIAPTRRRAQTWITATIAAMLVIEIVCIAGQAARGTTSHFNDATALDGAIFSVMGIAITINTVAVAALLWVLRRDTPPARAGYLHGVRLGLAVFVVGSLLGFVIVANGGHSVPGPDGGPGLPFLNWSVDRGDLRVAHFVGLHALQALPIVGHLLDRSVSAPARRARVVSAVATTWLVLMGATLALALAERPLLPL
ncbi:MAG: hypothetical protein AB7U83_03770 [Vicinamibacterales bacterium]